MKNYLNRNGDSSVTSYELGSDFIKVKFDTGKIYRYSYSKAGKENVERMKLLASQGSGLNGFIKTVVNDKYD